MSKSPKFKPPRARCEYFDLHHKPAKLWLLAIDARRFVDLGYASWKPGSRTEINLRSDLTLIRDPFGKAIRPIGREVAQKVHRLLEPILGVKLNCTSWSKLSPILVNPTDLHDPRIARMPYQAA